MGLHVLLPGTFDPPTLGHGDLVRRAAALFERVVVAVAEHPKKRALFSLPERLSLLEACFADPPRVEIAAVDALVVDACRRLRCSAIVRGVRSGTDYDYEAQMSATNRTLAPEIDTLLLATSPPVAHVSSTLVRQIAHMGGEVEELVPPPVAAALRERFG